MKTEKDWTDALREQCFPEEVSPSPESWAGITGKMHRRAVRRWGIAAVAAFLIPVSGVLLFHPDSTPDPSMLANHYALESTTPSLLAELSSARISPIPKRRDTPPKEPSAEKPSAEEPVPEQLTPKAPVIEEQPVFWPETEPISPGAAVSSQKRFSVTLHAESGAGRMDSYPQLVFAQKLAVKSIVSKAFLNELEATPQSEQFHYRHDIPLSVGLSFRWELSRRIGLESGLTYTYLHSYEPQLGDQRLHFLGIPLKLDARLLSAGHFQASLGGYGMVEKCLSAVQGGLRVNEPSLQWSSGLFLDAGYRLGRNAMLYLEPTLSYYFTQTTLITYRTENRLGFTLQAGLRFYL